VLGGSIAVVIVLGVFLLDRQLATPWCSLALVVGGVVAGALELFRMLAASALGADVRVGVVFAAGFLIFKAQQLLSGSGLPNLEMGTFVLFVLVTATLAFIRGDANAGMSRLFANVLGFLVVVLYSYLLDILVRFQAPLGLSLVFLLVFTSKSNDIGGYLIGRQVGGPKLAPGISPGKTWSGALGGVGLCLLVAVGLGRWFDLDLGPVALLAFGVAVSVATQVGDLFESMLKRYCGAGDSSALLPTFGGVLDVIDSLILAAPVGYFVLEALL